MDSNQLPIVAWPFGDASFENLTASGVQNILIANNLTFIDGDSVMATGDRTLKLSAASVLGAGARLVLKHKATGTEAITPGALMQGTTITGVAGKTIVVEYIYDGAAFIQLSQIQID